MKYFKRIGTVSYAPSPAPQAVTNKTAEKRNIKAAAVNIRSGFYSYDAVKRLTNVTIYDTYIVVLQNG